MHTAMCLAITLVSCTVPAGEIGTNADPVLAVHQVPYEGIYLLGSSTLTTLPDTDQPFVDGFALRVAWTELDTGTTAPAYDFTVIVNAVAQLSTIGKKVSIGLDAQLVPQYVLDGAHTTYLTTVPGPGHTSYTAETAVTWDPFALAQYTAFITALADLKLCPVGPTCSASSKIALRDHPTLAGLRINIIGMGKLRQTSNNTAGTIFEVPSYRRGTFVTAVLANLHAAQDQMPKIHAWVPYFSVEDSISGWSQDPTLDEVLIAAITGEFDGSSSTRPVMGFFEELLKGNTPDSTGTDGLNLLAARAAGAFVTFQACGGWANGSLCTFAPTDHTPENGFAFGYGTYGTRYYELYDGDITDPDFATMFPRWDAFLDDAVDALNPVALTAHASGKLNVLAWTDTSTVEQGFIVERATDGQPFTPLGDPLAPDTTSVNDSTIVAGTAYSYRVHAYGAGGDYILSNVASVGGH